MLPYHDVVVLQKKKIKKFTECRPSDDWIWNWSNRKTLPLTEREEGYFSVFQTLSNFTVLPSKETPFSLNHNFSRKNMVTVSNFTSGVKIKVRHFTNDDSFDIKLLDMFLLMSFPLFDDRSTALELTGAAYALLVITCPRERHLFTVISSCLYRWGTKGLKIVLIIWC